MGYNDDYREGYRTGGWSNHPDAGAFNDGARAAQRDRDEQMRRAYAPKPPVAEPASPPVKIPQWTPLPTHGGNDARSGSGAAVDKTLADFAKSGAVLGGIAFVGFALVQLQAWNWLQIGIGAALAAAAGAAAGAALYVALKLLAIAVKAAFILLGVGVILHLLGAINFFQVLGAVGSLVQSSLAS